MVNVRCLEVRHVLGFENHPASQVLSYLYVGNMRDASDPAALRDSGIRYVLNVTAKPPDYDLQEDIVYKQLHAADNGVQVGPVDYLHRHRDKKAVTVQEYTRDRRNLQFGQMISFACDNEIITQTISFVLKGSINSRPWG